jgi:hypothetical protein
MIGKDFLDKFIENQPEYREASDSDKKKMKKEGYNKWMGYLLLLGSNRTKYGSILTSMASQYSLKNNQYPEDVSMATNVLANHKFDTTD